MGKVLILLLVGMLFLVVPFIALSETVIKEKIISKKDADYIFSLNKGGWEAYVKKIVIPKAWEVRLSPSDTGTFIMALDPVTKFGLIVQPMYSKDNTPPDVLFVSSYFPIGTLPKFTEDFKRGLETEAKKDLGAEYDVSVVYSKIPLLRKLR